MPDRYSLDALEERKPAVLTDLDPRLQGVAIAWREVENFAFDFDPLAEVPEISVIALVTDIRAWELIPGVRPGISIPRQIAEDHDLVTGRIATTAIETVRQQPCVVSLKGAHLLHGQLLTTVPDLGVAALPPGCQANSGRGVVVGIVDFGCDFVHQNFRNADGSTRLQAIWDQNGKPATAGVKFGHVYLAPEINAALQRPDPYAALGYSPPNAAHGTHVMDIAAGNGRGSGQAGVASEADLIFVEVAANAGGQNGTSGVGDSVQLLEAIQFIFDYAGDRPCVINVSLGANGGAHDGSSLVELGLDRLVDQQANRCIVVAAGNAFSDGIHAVGKLAQGGAADLKFEVAEGNPTGSELEIWYAGADRFDVDVIGPDGKRRASVPAGQTRTIGQGHSIAVMVASRLGDPNNRDNQIFISLDKGLPTGTWTIRLHGTTVQYGDFHAWIERNDQGDTEFTKTQQDNSHTLGSLSCGRKSIVVGAYDAHTPACPICFVSSSGPTRDGRQKPDVSAHGQNVMAAQSRSLTKTTKMSGTSMACPAVTGTVALLLAQAKAAGRNLTADRIQELLKMTARNTPPESGSWHPQFGHGRITATGAIAKLMREGVVARQ